MAVDFDFDGTFNEDDAEDEGELEGFEDFDDEDEAEEEEEEEEEKPKRNPLRLILLALVVLILLCAVCALVINTGLLPFSIPGLGPQLPTPAKPPAQDTPASEPTDETSQLPATDEPAPAETDETEAATDESETVEPTDESPATTEPDTGPTVVIEPTGEPPTTTEPTQEPTDEPTVVITVESTITSEAPTSTAVPGPTPTSGPTVIITITPTDCDNNIPPIADAGGPYSAMRGKGLAVVNFDGSSSMDPDGAIINYHWDFGDESDLGSGETTTHGYNSIGSYEATLTVTDDCGATGMDTADVSIVGPTPPATGTPVTATPDPSATSTPVASATMGFCYRVQYGDTLSGLAWRFGVAWADLARVNGVHMHYFVIAGQGLFIPTDQIGQGPNVYEVLADDTLNSVAFQCGLTTATLAQANGLTPDDSVAAGDMLIIPLWKP